MLNLDTPCPSSAGKSIASELVNRPSECPSANISIGLNPEGKPNILVKRDPSVVSKSKPVPAIGSAQRPEPALIRHEGWNGVPAFPTGRIGLPGVTPAASTAWLNVNVAS